MISRGQDVKIFKDGRDTVSVLDWLEKAKEKYDPYLRRHAGLAAQATDIFHGRNLDKAAGYLAPPAGSNALRNMVLTRAARVREEKPSVKAWPGDAGYGDQAKTKVANSVLGHIVREARLDAKFSLAAIYVQLHGTVAFMPWWDSKAGKTLKVVTGRDENGRDIIVDKPRGAVCVDIKMLTDFMIDPCDDPADAKWCVFRTKIAYNDALAICDAAGINQGPAKITDNSGKETTDEVEVFEIWHVPDRNAGFDDGLYARVVGGHVVEAIDHPYEHKQLPICLWHECRDVGSPIGSTHVHDAINAINYLNELCEQRVYLSRTIARNAALLCHKRVESDLGKGSGAIGVDSVEQLQHAWISPPTQVLAYIEEQIRIVTQEIYQTVGVSESLSSAQSIRASTTGRALDMARRLDSQKLSHVAENFNACALRLFSQVLRLTQQYTYKEDIARIVGENGEMDAVAFIGEDLIGFDVVLEPTSGLEQTRAGMAESSLERVKLGFIDPARGQELTLSGLDVTASESMDEERLTEQINLAMTGQPVPPIDVNPKFAEAKVREAIVMLGNDDPQASLRLYELLTHYQQRAAESAQQNVQGAPPRQLPRGVMR